MIRFANIIRSAVKAQVQNNKFCPTKVFTRQSSITTWNKDWQPGPYPRTEEQRIAAAKKYNLLPEDYEPYPEEEGYGDYPKFPAVHNDLKDDFQVYDYVFLKRNYGEPIHPDMDICLGDRVNFQQEFSVPFWKQMVYLWSAVAIYCTLIWYSETHPADLRMVPKQYPHRGEVSYTFEPAE